MSEQNVPCCSKHKKSVLPDMKCACGSWLDLKESKYGPFWLCLKCGPVSWRKGLEVNPLTGDKKDSNFKVQSKHKEEEQIMSWEDL